MNLANGLSRIFITLLIVAVFQAPHLLWAQAPINCDSLLRQPIKDISGMESLTHCMDLDSVAMCVFSPSVLGVLSVKIEQDGKQVTYGMLADTIRQMMATKDYHKMAEMVNTQNLRNNTKVSIRGWQDHEKEQYLKMGVRKKDTDAFAEKRVFYHFPDFTNLDTALHNALRNGRYVLLYFSTNYDVDSREMEYDVLTDQEIKDLLSSSYDGYIIYTDDKITGKKTLQLEQQLTESTIQPAYVILTSTGLKINQLVGKHDKKAFLEFLSVSLSTPATTGEFSGSQVKK